MEADIISPTPLVSDNLVEAMATQAEIQKRDTSRFAFLHRLYDDYMAGEQLRNKWQIGQELGFSKEETSLVAKHLRDQGFIDMIGEGSTFIIINNTGIVEVESCLNQPEKLAAPHQPSTTNNVHIGSISGSQLQLQQGTLQSQQDGIFSLTPAEIRSIIEAVEQELPSLDFSEEDEDTVRTDIATIKTQLVAKKPKESVLRECLKSTRNILEGMTGSVIATGLLEMFKNISL